MSSQDKLEKVLRDIHVLISRSEVYDKDRIIVNKQDMFGLIDRLNVSIYEIMEDYELTKQSRDKAEREHKKQGDKIIWDASRKAEDIYAASVMYTDEALNHIQAIMDESTEQIKEIQNAMLKDLEEKKQIVRTNQLELKSQLQDLVDTEKYLSLIEERNKEIEREKEKHGRRFGQPKEKSQFADVKTEIRINKEYFRNAGIELEDDKESADQETAAGPDAGKTGSGEKTSEKKEFPEELPELGISETKELDIDLSGVEWDVDGLDDPEPAKDAGEEETGHRKRHFFKR
ncbi:MAG: hypothetical protein PUK75_12760 [bacterium]|nr:hypothetical protein [bacterium]MDY4100932.1 hypothetical protein [Lachnospiraceae bacterium]